MTDKPVVLVTRKLPDAVEKKLAQDFTPVLNPDDRLYDTEELLQLAENADAILPCHTERFSAETIARLPARVKAIANFSVGVDHVDLEAARQKQVIVTNTPDVLSDATAEIAMLLMLGAARRASEGERIMRNQQWKDWSPAFMVGRQITGKRLGILGMGRVGQVVAARARGFDMTIHYHNRKPLDASQAAGAEYHDSVEGLLAAIDVLSIHCPASDATRGLLNRERLALMHPDSILVNTSRGAVVDDDALVNALISGVIAAAGLDVYNGEPDAIHPGYRELDNVFLLPHIGSATVETRDAMGFRAIDNLIAIFKGEQPGDRVA
ncbi:MAG: D-glycerate dehydrogenase [Gammaproteobacteria bacterium]|nr:MAG: D-glycerate dehydrogenase [Gammaproteobacteria bacterium]UCH41485.1 MAG: D-glycerate dehydrogenase [Gammaproteobacteria bacterium]